MEANTWYILNISSIKEIGGSIGQSPTATYYQKAIKLSTYSSYSSTLTTANCIMYDYNNGCGTIALSPSPQQLSKLSISSSETDSLLISSIGSNSYYESTYPVYISIRSKGDYEYGGTYYLLMENAGFEWTGGSCECIGWEVGTEY